MMLPWRCARINALTCLICASAPRRCTAMVASKLASDRSSSRPPAMAPPALLTRMSTRPFAFEASAIVRTASASSAASASMNVAPVAFATSAPSAARRPLKNTMAPSSTKRSTMRLPMPLVPPVTIATLPLSLILSVSCVMEIRLSHTWRSIGKTARRKASRHCAGSHDAVHEIDSPTVLRDPAAHVPSAFADKLGPWNR
jgi:hypothetical protein